MRMITAKAARRLTGLGLVAVLAVGAAAPVLAAAGYRPQSVVVREGHSIVERSAHNEVDAAFTRAAALSRSSDEGLRTRLEAQKRDLAESSAGLGALRGVAPVEEMVFAGCVTHRYLVRYEQGKPRWMLKYRRGVDGWYLADLHVENI